MYTVQKCIYTVCTVHYNLQVRMSTTSTRIVSHTLCRMWLSVPLPPGNTLF